MRNMRATPVSDSICSADPIDSILQRTFLRSSRYVRTIRAIAKLAVLSVLISHCIGAQDPAPSTTPQNGAAQKSPSPEAPAGTPFFILDLQAPASGTPVSLSRPEDGLIALNIICGGTAPGTIELRTTEFTSDNGSVLVDILADRSNPASKQPQPVLIPVQQNAIVPLCLFIHPLPTAATYTGRLIISAPGSPPLIKVVTVAQPAEQQGTLVLDHTTLSQTFVGDSSVLGSVVLSEKTGKIALHGISVRLEQVSNSPEGGFDVEKNITFKLNGKEVNDLDHFPSAIGDPTTRTIPAGGQAVVNVALHDLGPGDYAAALRFTANNSELNDAQKLQMNVHVRAPLWRAVVCMLIALGISLLATKVLTSQRRRAGILQQINALQPLWLSSLPPTTPVVWVRAVLHQARKLSKSIFLPSPDLIEANVNKVKSVIEALDLTRQLREKLKIRLDLLVFRRAVLALDRVEARLATLPLTDAALESIKKDLNAFNDWLSDEPSFVKAFWNEIRPEIQSLQILMEEGDIPDVAGTWPPAKSLKADLISALTTPPTTQINIEGVYRKYCTLKILWSHRQELASLGLSAQMVLNDLLDLIDKRIWERTKAEKLSIGMPHPGDPGGLEAYQILQFTVVAPDPTIEYSYVFCHKIEYKWLFELSPKSLFHWIIWRRDPDKILLRPESLGPSVIQYFHRAGKLKVSVNLLYNDEVKPVALADELSIKKSSDFKPFWILEWAEFTSWAIAGIVAIATGLTMFYFKGTSWGSIQDYLTLFLWGVGVDQGKNFLQALQTYSAQPANPPPTPTTQATPTTQVTPTPPAGSHG